MKRWMSKSVVMVALVGAVATGTVVAAFAHGEGPQRDQGQRRGGPQIVQRLVEVTGLSPEELRAEFEAGKTPAEILSENGVDPNAFVAGILAEMETRLSEAVADGKMEQAQADEILANAAEQLSQRLNEPVNAGRGGQRGGRNPENQILGQLVEQTGLSPEEMRAAIEAGKTPAEILSENGVEPDAFVAGILIDMQLRLSEAVADGKMEQAQADEILAKAAEQLPQRLNEPVNAGHGGQRDGQQRFVRQAVEALTEATGLSPEALRAEFEAGKTPAEIIVENGGNPDAIIDEILANIETRLDEAVADGKIDQDRADEALENAGEMLGQWIDQTFTPGPAGRGHGEGQHPGFPPGQGDRQGASI